MNYFEDYEIGDAKTVGSFSLTKAEIIDFAEQFDPLWLHTNEERVKEESPFGEIIASGWHTLCSCHGLVVKDVGGNSAAIGSPGVEGVSWNRPVFPDETISVTRKVADKRPSKKDPSRGLLTVEISGSTHQGEEVITYSPSMYYLRKEQDEE